MKKFVMALTILAMGGTALVGVLNKKNLETEFNQLEEAREGVATTTSKLNDTIADLKKATEDNEAQENLRDAEAAKVGEEKLTLGRKNAEIAGLDKEISEAKTENEEIDMLIRKVFPDGNIRTVEDVRKEKQMLDDALTEKTNSKSQREAELASAVKALGEQQARVKAEEAKQIERAQQIALNGLEATVIAVNRDWGFVMVNAGKNYGVTAESSMLVKRGNQKVARLRIVSLEPDMVVCDIVQSELGNAKINAGDKVIFENTK